MNTKSMREKIIVPLALLGAVGCTIITNPKPAEPPVATPPAATAPPATTAPGPAATTTTTATAPVASAAPPVVTPTPATSTAAPPASSTPPAASGGVAPPRIRLRLPGTGVAPADPVMTAPNIFGSPTKIEGALEGVLYYLPPGSRSFPPQYFKRKVETRLYLTELNIPLQRFEGEFPGLPNRPEYFAIRYSGQFTVATSGSYDFRLHSDDGSKLTIDNVPVVNNDGVHDPKSMSGSINLAAGTHSIIVDYFQGPKWRVALQLFVTGPDGREKLWGLKI